MYTYGYLELNKGNIRDAAFVVSVHDDVLNRTVRINLKKIALRTPRRSVVVAAHPTRAAGMSWAIQTEAASFRRLDLDSAGAAVMALANLASVMV